MATKKTTKKKATKTKTTKKSTITPSASKVLADPTQSLQKFDLLDLQPYTQEQTYSSTASKDFHLFYVGRDDVHEILKHILSRVSVSLYLNMFGYDDDELNDIIMTIARDPTVSVLITLDKSQAGGAHEKALLASDVAKYPALFNTSITTGAQSQALHDSGFVIGQSATHQISHTKGFVAGYKAQNNTQSVFTDPDTVSRFSAELVREHVAAARQKA
jgi:hypothetical protein